MPSSTKHYEQTGFKDMPDLLKTIIDRIDWAYHGREGISSLSSGFKELDSMCYGFLEPGNLIVIAGRPSMGKTTLAMNIAEHVSVEENAGVAIFSLDHSAETLTSRMLSSIGSIDQSRIRSGNLNEEDMGKLTHAVKCLESAKIFIDDTGPLSPKLLNTKIEKLKQQHDIGLIIIDYLQLITIANSVENRFSDVSEISRNLKLLAKELNIPVIVLSQINQDLEQRLDKRPILNDLRSYGELEQVVDTILFIYRDEVYNPETNLKGTAEIIIGKQKSGELKLIPLRFQVQYNRFSRY